MYKLQSTHEPAYFAETLPQNATAPGYGPNFAVAIGAVCAFGQFANLVWSGQLLVYCLCG